MHYRRGASTLATVPRWQSLVVVASLAIHVKFDTTFMWVRYQTEKSRAQKKQEHRIPLQKLFSVIRALKLLTESVLIQEYVSMDSLPHVGRCASPPTSSCKRSYPDSW